MLEKFFSGLLHQLQAEIDLINALVPHNATKGVLNEESLKRILQSFLPNRYAIGSGFVIDSLGGRSKQVDIVIYDGIYSSKLFNNFSQVIFPVETVFACIEVKTSISKSELTEITQENKSIGALKHYAQKINRIRPSLTTPFALDFSELDTRPPLTFTVAYHTATKNPLTIKSWYEECPDKEHLPDFTLFLDLALIVFRPKPIEKLVFDFLLMPVRNTDIGESGVEMNYLNKPGQSITLNGRAYKSSEWKSKTGYPLVMPEKALLSFIIQLNRAIDSFPKHESFDPTPYLADSSDEGLEIL